MKMNAKLFVSIFSLVSAAFTNNAMATTNLVLSH